MLVLPEELLNFCWPIQSGFNHDFKDTDLPDMKCARLMATGSWQRGGTRVCAVVRKDQKSELSGWSRMWLILLSTAGLGRNGEERGR